MLSCSFLLGPGERFLDRSGNTPPRGRRAQFRTARGPAGAGRGCGRGARGTPDSTRRPADAPQLWRERAADAESRGVDAPTSARSTRAAAQGRASLSDGAVWPGAGSSPRSPAGDSRSLPAPSSHLRRQWHRRGHSPSPNVHESGRDSEDQLLKQWHAYLGKISHPNGSGIVSVLLSDVLFLEENLPTCFPLQLKLKKLYIWGNYI